MLTCPPARFPYSAPYVCSRTLYSRTASTPSNWELAPDGVMNWWVAFPPNPVDPVNHEPVGFLPMARNREGGKTAAASHIGTIIGDTGIENQKLIEASPIQRQVFDLLLSDQSGRRTQCRVH